MDEVSGDWVDPGAATSAGRQGPSWSSDGLVERSQVGRVGFPVNAQGRELPSPGAGGLDRINAAPARTPRDDVSGRLHPFLVGFLRMILDLSQEGHGFRSRWLVRWTNRRMSSSSRETFDGYFLGPDEGDLPHNFIGQDELVFLGEVGNLDQDGSFLATGDGGGPNLEVFTALGGRRDMGQNSGFHSQGYSSADLDGGEGRDVDHALGSHDNPRASMFSLRIGLDMIGQPLGRSWLARVIAGVRGDFHWLHVGPQNEYW
jgi:hypothetical protein